MKNRNALIASLISSNESGRLAAFCLLTVFVLSAAIRIATLGVGSPFITIDDKTAFEGGFLVWFGHAPPQRMYLESFHTFVTGLPPATREIRRGWRERRIEISNIQRR